VPGLRLPVTIPPKTPHLFKYHHLLLLKEVKHKNPSIKGGTIMNRQLLEQPFTPDQIKQRKGNFGRDLTYLEGHAVIQRLNDALEADWSFEILHHELFQDEVLVKARLTTGTISKTHFGSSTITRNKKTGDLISLGDDLKAATTDALKKAATLLGVGNYLYSAETGVNGGNRAQQQGQHHPGNNGRQGIPVDPGQAFTGPNSGPGGPNGSYPASNSGHGNNHPNTMHHGNATMGYNGQHPNAHNIEGSDGNTPASSRLSSKQLGYLNSIAKENAMTNQELNAMAVQRFGTQVSFLSKKDASQLISDLTTPQTAA
jgi:hypothetical protein